MAGAAMEPSTITDLEYVLRLFQQLTKLLASEIDDNCVFILQTVWLEKNTTDSICLHSRTVCGCYFCSCVDYFLL